MRGAEHIVRLIAHRDDRRAYVTRRQMRRAWNRGNVSGSLIGLTGPVIVLEYLDNGDISRLHYRLIKDNILLPNRVLWAFFLCCRPPLSLRYVEMLGSK